MGKVGRREDDLRLLFRSYLSSSLTLLLILPSQSHFHCSGNPYQVSRMNWPVQSFLLAADLGQAMRLPLSVTSRGMVTCRSSPSLLRVSGWLELVKGFLA